MVLGMCIGMHISNYFLDVFVRNICYCSDNAQYSGLAVGKKTKRGIPILRMDMFPFSKLLLFGADWIRLDWIRLDLIIKH